MARKISIKALLDRSQFNKDLEQLEKEKVNIPIGTTGTDSLKNTTSVIKNINVEAEKSKGIFTSLKDSIKNTFSSTHLATFITSLYVLRTASVEAKKSIEEIDKAITDLRIATNGTFEDTKKLVQSYNDMAKTLGSTTVSVSESSDDFLRAGKTMEEANALIKDSTMLSKLGKIGASESTKDLLAVMNGYDMSIQEVNSSLDAMVAIDMKASTSAGDISTALKYCASNANNAKVSFNDLSSMIAVVQDKTQSTAETVGVFMNTILSRYKDIKIGNYLTEDGEDISNYESVLKKVGVQLRDASGEFRDYENVLNDLHTKWNSLNSVDQAAVIKVSAGTRQQNRFQALLTDYDKVKELSDIAANSAGTSTEKFNAYLDSVEAKSNTLQASFESLVLNSDLSEVYKGILDASSALVQFIDNTGLLKTTFGALAVGAGIKVFTQIGSGIISATKAMNDFGVALNIVKDFNVVNTSFNQLLAVTEGLSASQTKLILSSEMLSNSQRINILMNQGLSESESQAILSTYGLATSEGVATGATLGFSAVIKGLTMSLKAFLLTPLGWFTVFVTFAYAASKAYDALTVSLEEATESMEKAKGEFDSATNEIKNLEEQCKTCGEKIKELQKLADNGTISLVEQEELDKLKKTNEELELSLKLEREKKQLASIEAANSASDTLSANVTSNYKTDKWESGSGNTEVVNRSIVTPEEELNLAIARYKELDGEINNLKESYKHNEINASEYESALEDLNAQQLEARKRASEMSDATTASEQSFKDLKNSAGELSEEQKYQLTSVTKTNSGYYEWIDTLDKTSIALDDVAESEEKADDKQPTFDLTATVENLSNLEKQYQTLYNAQEELKESGGISAETFKGIIDSGLTGYLEEVNGQLTVNVDKFYEQGEVTKQAAIASLQEAMSNDIMNLSLGNTGELSDIAKSAIASLGDNAETAGVQAANASGGLNAFAIAAQNAVDGAKGNLKGGLDTKIFMKESQAVIDSYTKIASQVGNISLSNGKSASKSSEKDLFLQAFNDELDNLKSLHDAGKLSEKDYLNYLRKLYERYFANRKKYAKEYAQYEHEYLQGMESLYSDVFSYATKLIDKQIDKLQDQKQAAADVYESQKDALDDQIKGLQDQIDYKQKEIDKINEAAEARQREIDLEKEKFALEKAQTQRTISQYSQDKGFTRVTNTDDIRDAQEGVDNANKEIQIASIEKEISTINDSIDALDRQKEAIDRMIESSNVGFEQLIKSLEDSKTRWEELSEVTETAEMRSKLSELGYTEQDILSMTDAQFGQLKTTYMNLLADMYRGNDTMMTQLSKLSGMDLGNMTGFLASTADELSRVGEIDLGSVNEGVGNLTTSTDTLNESVGKVSSSLDGGGGSSEGENKEGSESSGDKKTDSKKGGSGSLLSSLTTVTDTATSDEGIPAVTTVFVTLDDQIQKVIESLDLMSKKIEMVMQQASALNSMDFSGGGKSYGSNGVPIGEYDTGTRYAPKGWAKVAEKNKPEIIIDNDGNAFLATKPTLVNMEGGEKVISSAETEDVLGNKLVSLSDYQQNLANGIKSNINFSDFSHGYSLGGFKTPDYSNTLSGITTKNNSSKSEVNQYYINNVSLPNLTAVREAEKLCEAVKRLPLKAKQQD